MDVLLRCYDGPVLLDGVRFESARVAEHAAGEDGGVGRWWEVTASAAAVEVPDVSLDWAARTLRVEVPGAGSGRAGTVELGLVGRSLWTLELRGIGPSPLGGDRR